MEETLQLFGHVLCRTSEKENQWGTVKVGVYSTVPGYNPQITIHLTLVLVEEMWKSDYAVNTRLLGSTHHHSMGVSGESLSEVEAEFLDKIKGYKLLAETLLKPIPTV